LHQGGHSVLNIAIVIIVLLSAWKWADWKNWQKYHATMLLAIVGNLLYNVIYFDHYLWRIAPGFLKSYDLTELLYTFITLPLTALMFLSNYPIPFRNQVLHIFKYIFVYSLVEYIFYLNDMIYYQYWWNFWWSVVWNLMMFSVWALHHKKPLWAYFISFLTFIAVIILFPININ